MPLDLGELLARTAEVVVAYAGQEVVVQYRPEAFTVETTEAIRGVEGDDTATLALLVDLLVGLVAGWDVTEDGALLPVTAATLRRLPLRLLVEVTTAIAEDIADPNRTTARRPAATPSPSGSSAAENSGRPIRLVGTG